MYTHVKYESAKSYQSKDIANVEVLRTNKWTNGHTDKGTNGQTAGKKQYAPNLSGGGGGGGGGGGHTNMLKRYLHTNIYRKQTVSEFILTQAMQMSTFCL